MIFSLDVRRARKGDCLLLHFGTKAAPGLILIDGGPSNVYQPQLRPRLEQIRKARGLASGVALPVDMLMVSHVDDDHIHGVLDLTAEMRANKAPLLRVKSFWHNSFDSIIANDGEELTRSFKGHVTASGDGGTLPADATVDADEDEEVIVSSLKVLASIEQGARLRNEAKALHFETNPDFDGKLVVARQGGRAIDIAGGLSFTVVGPMLPEIKALQKAHADWLEELAKKGMTPEEALASYVDKSVPNLSSIVVLAKAGDKSMLLTGDARGDKILAGLELVGAMKKKGKLKVDLIKVPHHGSSNNLDDDFFERVSADHYVFTGDGEHGNPEREALEMLVRARGEEGYVVHLTYPIDELDRGRKEDWQTEQAKERKKQAKNPAKKVRPNWSSTQHGLEAFFDAHKQLARNVKIVPDKGGHVIDLGDPLGKAWPGLEA